MHARLIYMGEGGEDSLEMELGWVAAKWKVFLVAYNADSVRRRLILQACFRLKMIVQSAHSKSLRQDNWRSSVYFNLFWNIDIKGFVQHCSSSGFVNLCQSLEMVKSATLSGKKKQALRAMLEVKLGEGLKGESRDKVGTALRQRRNEIARGSWLAITQAGPE